MSIAAMEKGKHVLCEKPLAVNLEESKAMVQAAEKYKVKLKCGFNHRYHPAIKKAKEAVDQGVIGELLLIRSYYGICGRPGYEKEWRADPKFVSGGQFMEQGIHLVDLCRWFLGDFSEVTCFLGTLFWQIQPLEDNAFAVYRNSTGKMASIHSSLTQWKNAFCFELVGKDGYITVSGLGGGYGTEKVTIGKRDFFKPFEDDTTEFRGDDLSWYEEWKEFQACIEAGTPMMGIGMDGVEALRLAFAAYQSDKTGAVVKL
jgi:predicted dehydrogenase